MKNKGEIVIEYSDDFVYLELVKIHFLFLQKLEKLTDDEREYFFEYLKKIEKSIAHIVVGEK